MKKEEFATAFSQKDQEGAIREISLKIKSIFPKQVRYLIIFFTPDYNPSSILKTINLTLKPQRMLGLQAPFLIWEEEVIQKGVVACCINKEGVEIQSSALNFLRFNDYKILIDSFFKKLRKYGFFFFSFVSSQTELLPYLNEMRSSLGKVFSFFGIGHIRKYSMHDSQIINGSLNEGLVNIAVKGLKIHVSRLEGYVTLGKPFVITKVASKRNIIMEINGRPAVDIYRHYVEEKFDIFIKNRLFSFYPLGVKTNGKLGLINVIDCLEDGSLLCLGEIKSRSSANIMFLDSTLLLRKIKYKLLPLKNTEPGLVFIANSLFRKEILKEGCREEIRSIKQTLGDKFKIVGLYSDYCFYSDEEKGDINTDVGNLVMTVWQ